MALSFSNSRGIHQGDADAEKAEIVLFKYGIHAKVGLVAGATLKDKHIQTGHD